MMTRTSIAVILALLALVAGWLALRDGSGHGAPVDVPDLPRTDLAVRTPVPVPDPTSAATEAAVEPAPVLTPVAPAPLPPTLVELPAGEVTMGLDAEGLLAMATTLSPGSASARRAILRNCLSELGIVTRTVEACYLGRHPVTNAEYKVFVEATGARFPYHWWTDGRKDDFESKERRLAIAELPQSHDKNVTYWENNWKRLPWAIPAGTENHPVTNVSWAEAIAYAAWAGMRLPMEAEWTFAATGGKPKNYLLGDTWTNDWLEGLELKDNADRRGTRPVGSVTQFASGPYGHDDMVGGVWEWMFDDDGYVQRAPRHDFDREFDKLKKSPGLDDLLTEFRDEHRILKGGSYLSAAAPVQLRLGVRAHAQPTETAPAAGFRVAKSPMPARDMTRARVRDGYDYSMFGNRRPHLDDQVGIERYAVADGCVRGYAAVSVTPISDFRVTDSDPTILGTLITTVRLRSPLLEPGIYTIYHHAAGATPAEFSFWSNGSAAKHQGELVAHAPARREPESKADYVGAGVSVVGENGRAVATFVFGVPTTGDRHVVFSLRLELDEPADAEHPWRTPSVR